MGASLSTATSATPGVLVAGTVDPVMTSVAIIVQGNNDDRRISEQIDASYIENGDTAYWTNLFLDTDGTMGLRLKSDLLGVGTEEGPQFTATALANLWVVLFYGTTSAAWEGAELDNSDMTEPYIFSAASVTAAGPTNNATLRTAILADSTVIAMLVDGSHPNIDIANLEIADPPEAPTAPTVTSTGSTSISATLSADPTSDSPITSRDIRWKVASAGDDTFTEVLDVTSPASITGLTGGTEYAVQWRANSGAESGTGAWSPSDTATTDSADLMPTVDAIDDVTVEQGAALDETLPEATGGDLPVTYSMTGLASWMSFDAATRRLTGTAPNSTSTTTVTYIATDTDGDMATRDFDVIVPAKYNVGDTLRLDSLDDLSLIFTYDTGGTNDGRWQVDSGGSTGSSDTGPGTNSSGPYVYTEASGNPTLEEYRENSTATVIDSVMSAWTGTGRIMAFRTSIAGGGTFQVGGGLVIEGRASGSDSWSEIETIEGWDYSSTGYSAGGTLTDSAGDTQTIAQDGGWVDYAVTIPDTYTQVRVRGEANSSGTRHKHDLALWNMELRQGSSTTPLSLSDPADASITYGNSLNLLLPEATGGDSSYTYSATGLASWMTFTPATRRLTGTPPNTAAATTITYTVTDGNSDTVSQMFDVTVVNVPGPTLTDPADATVTFGGTLNLTLPAATGGFGTLTYALTGLASWMGFNASTRQLTGTPPNADSTTTLTYTVTDSATPAQSASQMFDVTVNAVDAPEAPAAPTVAADGSTAITVTLSADPTSEGAITQRDIRWKVASAGDDTFTEVLDVTSPVTVSSLTSGTEYAVQWRAISAGGNGAWSPSGTGSTDSIPPPTLPRPDDVYVARSAALSVTLPEATGGDGTLTYSLTGLLSWMSFDATTRVLSGTAPNTATAVTLTYTVTDSSTQAATQMFRVIVYESATSLFHSDAYDIDGVMWTDVSSMVANVGQTNNRRVTYVLGTDSDFDSDVLVKSHYVVGGATAYVGNIQLEWQGPDPGRLNVRVRLDTSSSGDGGDAGPELTDGAESGFAMAIRDNDGTTWKTRLGSDTTEPYSWDLESTAPEHLNDSELNAITSAPARVVIFDANLPSISYDTLESFNPPDLMPTLPPLTDQAATIGELWSYTFPEATGGDLPITYTYETAGGSISWISITDNTISGTPPSDATNEEIVIVATDVDGDFATQTFLLTVNPAGGDLSLTDIPDQTAVAGQEFTLTPTVSGGFTPYTYFVSAIQGLTVSSAGVISGTPSTPGSYNITFTVTDDRSNSLSDTFSLFVQESGDNPLLSGGSGTAADPYIIADPLDVTDRSLLTYVEDLDGTPNNNEVWFQWAVGVHSGDWTVEIDTDPDNFNITLSLRQEGESFVTTTGAPGDQSANITLPANVNAQFRLNQGAGTPTAILLTITSPDVSPSFPDGVDDQTGVVGFPFSLTLPLATSGNIPITYDITAGLDLFMGLSFDAATRTISGNPENVVTTAVTYRATDRDGDEARVTFDLSIEADVEPTLGTIAEQAATRDTAYTQTLPEAMSGNAPITYAATSLPPGLMFAADTRVLSGTPSAAGTYTVSYTATDLDGDVATQMFDIVVADIAPNVPTGVTGRAVDSSRILVEWMAPTAGGEVDSYSLQYRLSTETAWTSVADIMGTSHEVSGLNSNTQYDFQVRAINAEGMSAWIPDPPLEVTTTDAAASGELPSEPRRLQAVSTNAGVVLTWLEPLSEGTGGAISGYNIWRHDGMSWTEIVADTGDTTLTYTDTATLTDNARYEYVVRAINPSGEGAWSAVIAVRVNPDIPSAPVRFRADNQTTGTVMVWEVPEEDGGSPITGYVIYRWTTGLADWMELTTVAATARTYTDASSLTPGDIYWYYIRAANANGNGAASEPVQVNINPDVPSAPRRLQIDAQSTGVVMNWLVPIGEGTGGAITGYNILRHDGTAWMEIVADTGNANLTYTDTATLTMGARYEYVIRAINPSGQGEWSQVVAVIINPNVPSAPQFFAVYDDASGVHLSWQAPLDDGGATIDGYRIYHWTASSGLAVWTLIDSTMGAGTTYTDTRTLTDGWHWYYIRAYNANGNGEPAGPLQVNTNPHLPGPPQSLTVTEVATGAQLSWQAPSSDGGSPITGYMIWRSSDGETFADVTTTMVVLTHIDTTMLAAGIYWYRVAAVNANGHGDLAVAQYDNQTTDPVTGVFLSPPANLRVQAGNASALLTWDDPVNPSITSYEYRIGDTGTWQTVPNSGAGTTEAVIESLMNDVEVTIYLRAEAGALDGPASSVTVTPRSFLPNLSLATAMAEMLPALSVFLDGEVKWAGGLVAEVERYSANMYGGPETAVMNVAGPKAGLEALLQSLRRPVNIQSAEAGLVWWGYAHRIEVWDGGLMTTATLDGFRTTVAVEYLRDGRDLGLRSKLYQEKPLADQYGRIEVIAAQQEDVPTDQELSSLLDPYLRIGQGVEVSRTQATGARIYAKGWSQTLDWQHAPRYAPPARIEKIRQDFGAQADYPQLSNVTDTQEVALWLPLTDIAGYDALVSSVRLWLTGPTDTWGGDKWEAALADTLNVADYPADDNWIDVPTSRLPRAGNGNPVLTEMDFSAIPHEIPAGATGVYIILRAETDAFEGARYMRAQPRTGQALYRRNTKGSGSWTTVTSNDSGENDPSKSQAAYDIFLQAKGQGYLRFLIQHHDILDSGIAPDVPEAVYTWPLYLEGVDRISQLLREMRQFDDLAYSVTPSRFIHFYEMGEREYYMSKSGVWLSKVPRGSLAMAGQKVVAGGEEAVIQSVAFTPRTGLWDLSFAAVSSATELARRSAPRLARQGP